MPLREKWSVFFLTARISSPPSNAAGGSSSKGRRDDGLNDRRPRREVPATDDEGPVRVRNAEVTLEPFCADGVTNDLRLALIEPPIRE